MDLEQVQQMVGIAQSTTPYVWEIASVCGLLTSLTITQWVKKIRWLPAVLCDWRISKPKEDGSTYSYKQPKTGFLDLLAIVQTFFYVAICLYIRYWSFTVLIIAFFACILQWKIVKIIFLKAKEKEGSLIADAIRGELYVPDDAPAMTKILAVATGGGIDKQSV